MAQDLAGRVVGRWTVVEYVGKSYWKCRCECGTVKNVFTGNLTASKTLSCGCLRKEVVSVTSRTHGLSKTAEYRVWAGMKRRCQNKNDKAYADYGGKGVTVCQQWSDSFESFLADVGKRPSAKHEIDRIDNSKGYEPGNCRWATRSAQANNKTNNRPITFNGTTQTLAAWGRATGIGSVTIQFRLDHGWTIERALTTPAEKGRNQFSKA